MTSSLIFVQKAVKEGSFWYKTHSERQHKSVVKDEEAQVANMEINWTEGQGEAEQRHR